MNDLINMLKLQQLPRRPALSNSPMTANEPAELHGLQMAGQSELSDRMFQNERLGPQGADELKALKGLFMRKNDEIRNGIVEQQRPQVENRMAELNNALSQGFGGVNPTGDMAAYGRQQGEAKINAPIEAARVAGQFDVQQADRAARGQVDVARQYGENQMRQTELQQQGAREHRNFYGARPGQGVPGLGAKGTIGSIAAPRQQNLTPLLKDFSASMENLQGLDPWDDANASSPAVMGHRSRWSSILAQHDAAPDSKEQVQEILRDPKYRNLQVEDIFDAASTDPQALAEVRELLSIARGGW